MSEEKELEQQGEIAADFIEEFLDVADLDGDLEIEFKKERVYISVKSDAKSNLGKISDPDTVEAVQELARLAVQAKTGEMSRLILDIGGSRQAKTDKLKQLALVARQQREEFTDPRLTEILNDIELRARVELAKYDPSS